MGGCGKLKAINQSQYNHKLAGFQPSANGRFMALGLSHLLDLKWKNGIITSLKLWNGL